VEIRGECGCTEGKNNSTVFMIFSDRMNDSGAFHGWRVICVLFIFPEYDSPFVCTPPSLSDLPPSLPIHSTHITSLSHLHLHLHLHLHVHLPFTTITFPSSPSPSLTSPTFLILTLYESCKINFVAKNPDIN
jgi:hypothetical protein